MPLTFGQHPAQSAQSGTGGPQRCGRSRGDAEGGYLCQCSAGFHRAATDGNARVLTPRQVEVEDATEKDYCTVLPLWPPGTSTYASIKPDQVDKQCGQREPVLSNQGNQGNQVSKVSNEKPQLN